MERKWLASSRRRSQRVMVSIPVQVEAKNSAGLDLVEETKTVSVSAHGALLRLEMPVTKGQTVILRNPSTTTPWNARSSISATCRTAAAK